MMEQEECVQLVWGPTETFYSAHFIPYYQTIFLPDTFQFFIFIIWSFWENP